MNIDDLRKELKFTTRTNCKPKTIWHYTNEDGLKGILESGTLWLTDHRFLNDKKEIKHALNKFDTVCRNWEINNATQESKNFLREFLPIFRDEFMSQFSCYVFSMSPSPDHDHLRVKYADKKYGPGTGFILGFDTQQLFSQNNNSFKTDKKDWPVVMEKVWYDKNIYIPIMEKMLSLTCAAYNKRDLSSAMQVYEISMALASTLVPFLPFIKKNKWKRENEYRLFCCSYTGRSGKQYGIPTEAQFRNQKGFPCVKWKFNPKSVIEVITGSSSSKHINQFLKDFIESKSYVNLKLFQERCAEF